MFPNNAKNQYHYSVLWSVYCKYNSQYVNKKTYEKRYCISKYRDKRNGHGCHIYCNDACVTWPNYV